MTTRRAFLAGSAAVLAATGCDAEQAPAKRFDPKSWASVRDQFSLDRGTRQLAAFVLASHPAPVRAAIDRHRRGLDADTAQYLATEEQQREEKVRATAAEYLAAPAGDIAFTDSTTMGLGLVYGGLKLAKGDEVLTTEHDFYSTHESLRLAAERAGATVRRVRLYDEPAKADADAIVEALRRAVTPRTRAVAVTWVHSSTGVRLPIRRIADALGPGPLLCVDGVHGFGADATPVAELGCDVFVTGCHKWLFGPRGTGLVWARPEAWARIEATIPTFDPAASRLGSVSPTRTRRRRAPA